MNIDNWFPSNSALAILDPYLKQHGVKCLIVSSSKIDQYLDHADVFGISVMDHSYFQARKLTEKLRRKTVIWGGWTATASRNGFSRKSELIMSFCKKGRNASDASANFTAAESFGTLTALRIEMKIIGSLFVRRKNFWIWMDCRSK